MDSMKRTQSGILKVCLISALAVACAWTAPAQQQQGKDAAAQKPRKSSQTAPQEKAQKTYSEADYQLAYELLEAAKVPAVLENSIDGMLDIQLKNAPQMTPYRNIFRNFFKKYLTYENLKKDYADIYLSLFTPEQMRELIRFYKTPTGQRFTEVTPEIAVRSAELGQRVMFEHMAELQIELSNAMSSAQLQNSSSPAAPKGGK